ncbi:MAG TPA: hypothetical protein VK171_05800 [Fimbriimonas sp.]|nr:hypothetical protein [Fimbriimonas sp.]
MKSLSLVALSIICASSFAQDAAWYAKRFGFNANPPDLFAHETASGFKDYAYNDGLPNVRFNNTSGIMTSTGLAKTGAGKSYLDPTLHQWADLYEITDLLPKDTWVRAGTNLQNHYPDPYNPTGGKNTFRNTDAIVGRLMFRGTDLSNTLCLLWVNAPAVYPSPAPNDSWKTLTVDSIGRPLPAPIDMGEPATRDWWRPHVSYHQYLRRHTQLTFDDINTRAAQIVRERTGSGPMDFNFVQRIGVQFGNEPSAGHPGGSTKIPIVGSWAGQGAINERTMSYCTYGPPPAARTAYQVPNNFGSNPGVMPAFSMLFEQASAYRLNYAMGRIRNIQWSGTASPGVNEIMTYKAEMTGMNWPSMCGRRALHFMSPQYHWKFLPKDQYQSPWSTDLLTSKPFSPADGRWETPSEYARRWVKEMERQVDFIASLDMPGSAKLVDITECYFTVANSYAVSLDANTKDARGETIQFPTKSLDELRELARNHVKEGNTLFPLMQPIPSRVELLRAIKNELYKRDVIENNLTPNLGRIYWWGGYYPNPRTESGLGEDGVGTVNSYNPFGDFRLTLDEVKAIWGLDQ